jgi:hypothetical protein
MSRTYIEMLEAELRADLALWEAILANIPMDDPRAALLGLRIAAINGTLGLARNRVGSIP